MRASTIVAILSLAAEVALSVALPLPAFKSERAGGEGFKRKHPDATGAQTGAPSTKKSKSGESVDPPLVFIHYEAPPPEAHPPEAHPPEAHPPLFTHEPLQQRPPPGSSSQAIALPKPHDALLQTNPRPDTPLQSTPGSPSHQPGLPPAGPPPQVNIATHPLYHPQPLYAYGPKWVSSHELLSSTPESLSSTPGSQHAPTTPPIVERELPEHVDQRIKLAARAYVRELLTASMDDLD